MNGPGLRLVESPEVQQAEVEVIHVGRRYSHPEELAGAEAAAVLGDADLCVAAYRATARQAQVVPLSTDGPGHLWNAEAAAGPLERSGASLVLAAGRLQLVEAGLDGPELTTGSDGLMLQMHTAFELDWNTHGQGGELGAVETVQSQRAIRFEDGGSLPLLDTDAVDGPVRYAHPDADDSPFRRVCGYQVPGRQARHRYSVQLQQAIPDAIDGRAVSEVTVLERYSSHFLQCENPQAPERHIWVPLLAPVSWGWSIRVGRRTDGEWGILRRKLLMPVLQDEGLVLPEWNADTTPY